MIKARIRWCTCRVENILTLGKLLSLWFCFLLHSILFLISQTSYHTYKIISRYELARPIMGTIFLVMLASLPRPLYAGGARFLPRKVGMCLSWSKKRRRNYVGLTRACSKSVLGGKIRPYYSFRLYARATLAWTEENVYLEMRNLKQTELHRLKNRGKKG